MEENFYTYNLYSHWFISQGMNNKLKNGLPRKKYLWWEITWKIILWYAENLYTTIIFCNIQKGFVVIKHFTTKGDQFIRKKQKPWLFISYINILTWHFKNKCFGYHIMNCLACFFLYLQVLKPRKLLQTYLIFKVILHGRA